MKVAYEVINEWHGECQKVVLTGRCKTIKGGLGGPKERLYREVRFLYFFTRWVFDEDIKFVDPVETRYFQCDCMEKSS